jgi:hypothetical protein
VTGGPTGGRRGHSQDAANSFRGGAGAEEDVRRGDAHCRGASSQGFVHSRPRGRPSRVRLRGGGGGQRGAAHDERGAEPPVGARAHARGRRADPRRRAVDRRHRRRRHGAAPRHQGDQRAPAGQGPGPAGRLRGRHRRRHRDDRRRRQHGPARDPPLRGAPRRLRLREGLAVHLRRRLGRLHLVAPHRQPGPAGAGQRALSSALHRPLLRLLRFPAGVPRGAGPDRRRLRDRDRAGHPRGEGGPAHRRGPERRAVPAARRLAPANLPRRPARAPHAPARAACPATSRGALQALAAGTLSLAGPPKAAARPVERRPLEAAR